MPPKPPPTSGAITRILASEMLQQMARKVRTKCGTWVDVHIVSSPELGVAWTTTPRGSIEPGTVRWLWIRCLTTNSARSNAASTPSVRWVSTMQVLSG